MEPLWKLPPFELVATRDGGWAVQSEDGLGDAQAVFVPLRRKGEWELALADGDVLPLSGANDREWLPVRLPAIADASHFLCVLRYDHPADHQDSNFLVAESRSAPVRAPTVHASGAELRLVLQRMRAHLGGRFDLYLVPAKPAAASAGRAQAPTAEPPEQLCFAFASCQYPAGLLDRPMAHRSYEKLAQALARPGAQLPERLLLLGDQVYTDATYGLVDPARLDDRYRIPYEDFGDRQGGPFASLPQTFLARRRMTPDDHEIRDNWEPTLQADPTWDKGMAAYWKYQRRGGQPGDPVHMPDEGPGWRLFMTDSRTCRQARDEGTLDQALILGEPQTSELEEWLREGTQVERAGQLNIVTSAAMLLPRTRMYLDEPLYLDAWQGYPASLRRLLALVCELQLPSLVFLSGDAHLACKARVQVKRLGSDVQASFLSLHAPALYAPYPFANEEEANLLLQDSFDFPWGGHRYQCTVSAQVLGGGANGCGMLLASRQGGRWCLDYQVLLAG